MAKVVREKVLLRGKTRMLSPRALEIATRHFGATRKSSLEREVPVELLKIPEKVEVIKKPAMPSPEGIQKRAEEIMANVQKPKDPQMPAPVEVIVPKTPMVTPRAEKKTPSIKKPPYRKPATKK